MPAVVDDRMNREHCLQEDLLVRQFQVKFYHYLRGVLGALFLARDVHFTRQLPRICPACQNLCLEALSEGQNRSLQHGCTGIGLAGPLLRSTLMSSAQDLYRTEITAVQVQADVLATPAICHEYGAKQCPMSFEITHSQ